MDTRLLMDNYLILAFGDELLQRHRLIKGVEVVRVLKVPSSLEFNRRRTINHRNQV